MVAMPEGGISVTSHFAPLIPNSWYSDLLTSGLSEKWWKGRTIHIAPQYPPFFII